MAGTPELIGGMNRQLILSHLQKQGPSTRGDLSRALGLSFPSVSANLETLLQRGMVTTRVLESAPGGGRRPAQYAYNAQWGNISAVDLGRHRVRLMVCDALGNRLASGAFIPEEGAVPVPEQVLSRFLALLEEAGVPRDKVKLVSFGIPGLLDPETGHQVFAPFLHPSLRRHRMDLYFEEKLGLKTCIQNSVNLAAIAEKWQGAGVNRRNIVYVDLAVGLGSALILNGDLYDGHSGAAGEIGYMLPGVAHRRKAFEEEGVLEKFLSAYELQRKIAGRSPGGTVEGLIAGEDAALAPLLEELKAHYAMTLVNLAAVVNPEVIISGGGVGKALATLHGDFLEAALKAHVPYPPRLLPAQLDGNASVLGAVAYALRLLHNDASHYL